jgi:NADH:ubiquinone oxidoreductase subunit 6 (subunit J)
MLEIIILIIAILAIYFPLTIVVALWAEKKNRSYWIWLTVAFFVTPLICVLILICIGEKSKNISNPKHN